MDDLECIFCSMFPYMIKACKECRKCFCEEHIVEWYNKSPQNTCPSCIACQEYNDLTTLEKNKVLYKVTLTGCPVEGCDLDNKQMRYEDVIHHLEK